MKGRKKEMKFPAKFRISPAWGHKEQKWFEIKEYYNMRGYITGFGHKVKTSYKQQLIFDSLHGASQ